MDRVETWTNIEAMFYKNLFLENGGCLVDKLETWTTIEAMFYKDLFLENEQDNSRGLGMNIWSFTHLVHC